MNGFKISNKEWILYGFADWIPQCARKQVPPRDIMFGGIAKVYHRMLINILVFNDSVFVRKVLQDHQLPIGFCKGLGSCFSNGTNIVFLLFVCLLGK